MTKFAVLPVLLLSMLVLSGCQRTSEPTIAQEDRPPEELFQEAQAVLDGNGFSEAASRFEEIDRLFPNSSYATRSQIMASYAYYQDNDYDNAILSAQRFLQIHPGNEDAAYASYLIALSYYERITDVGRDQKITLQADQALREVINRYPDSDYARDSQLKLDLVNDHLAGKEMDVGRYYQQRQEYLAAIARFRNVAELFQTTSQVPEALHRLTETYLALGVVGEARQTAALLGHNFPDSDWYARSYALLEGEGAIEAGETEENWFQRLIPG